MSSARENRIQHFKDLTSIKDYYHAVGDISLSPAYMFSQKQNNHTLEPYDLNRVYFTNDNVIETLTKVDDVAVLVFASAKNPGGGVLKGSIAQEEAISYHTSWYFQAQMNTAFYSQRGDSALNTDKVSIANGFIFTDINHKEIEPPKPITFIACAAPNKTGIQSQKLNISDEIIYQHLNVRIQNILLAAEQSKTPNLILGAFGCGVFGLDPKKVALIFKENIEKGFYSGSIIFSIMDLELLNLFKEIISDYPTNTSSKKKSL